MDTDELILRVSERMKEEFGPQKLETVRPAPCPVLSEADRRMIMDEPKRMHSLFDHTALSAGTATPEVERLCREAVRYRFFAVCVHPIHVRKAVELLAGSGVKVVSVVGFPLAGTFGRVKAVEAESAIREGADEIDMVINVSALKSGALKTVKNDIEAVRSVCTGPVLLKVIIETGVLTEEEKVEACLISLAAGADFVKTSTGFGPSGAAASDVVLMRRVVGDRIGVKAAAGIRNLETALAMVGAGADRIGCSASVRIMQEARGEL